MSSGDAFAADAFLDGLRREADPEADAVVAAYFADRRGEEAAGLFGALVAAEASDPHVAAYLAHAPHPPPWVDPALVAAGQECFARWGPHVFTALYAGALPSAYAAWRGVQVLYLTARLVTDTTRRLNETAQFHLDVMRAGGLEPGAAGARDLRRVRLMHAAVRWMIRHDPRAAWDPAWGVPINQEDLLETLLTFTEVVFEVFDRTGVDYAPADAEAYLHVWSLAGHHLGIRPDLLPLRRDRARRLMAATRRRQYGPSEAGQVLTAALLDQGRRLAPPGLRGLPASTLRWYVGDEVADLLRVPPADWTRVVFGPLARLTRVVSLERAHRRLLRGFSDRVGYGLLELMVRAERRGGRARFEVPTELADRWSVDASGARVGGLLSPAGRGGRRWQLLRAGRTGGARPAGRPAGRR